LSRLLVGMVQVVFTLIKTTTRTVAHLLRKLHSTGTQILVSSVYIHSPCSVEDPDPKTIWR